MPAIDVGPSAHVIVGNLFTFSKAGRIVGARFYRAANDDNEHYASVMDEADNALLGVARFHYNAGLTPVGWQHAYFHGEVKVEVGKYYYLCVAFTGGHFTYTDGALSAGGITSGYVTCTQDDAPDWNGIYGLNLGRDGWNHSPGSRFGVDVLFLPEGGI